MAETVPTNGFVVPPLPTGPSTPTPANPAPNNPVPQFAAPPTPAPQAPAPEQPAAQPSQEGDTLAKAVAQLTELFNKQAEGQAPEEEPTQESGDTDGYGDLNSFDVESLEDPVHRGMALALLEGIPDGFDLNRALGLALDRGDASLIDRGYIRDKCGKGADNKIRIAEGLVKAANAHSASIKSSVYEAAGGESQWFAAVAVFNKAAPAPIRHAAAALMDSGDSEKIKSAAALVVQFGRASGGMPVVNPRLDGGATIYTGEALDKAAFQEELAKLDKNSRDYQAQRDALFARRTLGRKLGK